MDQSHWICVHSTPQCRNLLWAPPIREGAPHQRDESLLDAWEMASLLWPALSAALSAECGYQSDASDHGMAEPQSHLDGKSLMPAEWSSQSWRDTACPESHCLCMWHGLANLQAICEHTMSCGDTIRCMPSPAVWSPHWWTLRHSHQDSRLKA